MLKTGKVSWMRVDGMSISSRLMLTAYRIQRQSCSGHSGPGSVLHPCLPFADYRCYTKLRASLDGTCPAQGRNAHPERSACIVLLNERMPLYIKQGHKKASYQIFAIAIAPDGTDHLRNRISRVEACGRPVGFRQSNKIQKIRSDDKERSK